MSVPSSSVQAAKDKTTARSEGPKFSKESTSATDDVYIYAYVAGAQDAYRRLASKATRTCLGEELAKFFKKETKAQGAGIKRPGHHRRRSYTRMMWTGLRM